MLFISFLLHFYLLVSCFLSLLMVWCFYHTHNLFFSLLIRCSTGIMLLSLVPATSNLLNTFLLFYLSSLSYYSLFIPVESCSSVTLVPSLLCSSFSPCICKRDSTNQSVSCCFVSTCVKNTCLVSHVQSSYHNVYSLLLGYECMPCSPFKCSSMCMSE